MTVAARAVYFLSILVLAACSSDASDAPDITFMHLNDTYRIGSVESGSAGGFARVTTKIRELQAGGRNVVLLHGGDFLYPSLESQLWDGQQIVDAMNFMNELAPLVVVAGNHEFDRRTPAQLADAMRASGFTWVGDNYTIDTGDPDVDSALRKAHVLEVAGRRVGFFSVTLHANEGGNDRDYLAIDYDYVGSARRTIEVLEAAGVDLIVGLTHVHMWNDRALARLRKEHPTFLFIAGGHEHEPEYEPPVADVAAIVKGASNARSIWQIDVTFDSDGTPAATYTPLDLDADVAEDAAYVEQVESRWRSQLLERFPFLTSKVGEAALPLDGREVTIRNEESNWGNFVADQMRVAFGDEPANLAFLNSGTLRIDDFVSGEITFEDIGRTFGFSSYLRQMTITGADFLVVMEAGYRGSGPSKGYFPQVSGFRICVDRERLDGERIVSLQVPADDGWQEIDPLADYSLVVSDFVYGGGDGYLLPQDAPVTPPGSELKYLVLDAVMRAQANGEKVGAPVDPAAPRYVELGPERDTCWD